MLLCNSLKNYKKAYLGKRVVPHIKPWYPSSEGLFAVKFINKSVWFLADHHGIGQTFILLSDKIEGIQGFIMILQFTVEEHFVNFILVDPANMLPGSMRIKAKCIKLKIMFKGILDVFYRDSPVKDLFKGILDVF